MKSSQSNFNLRSPGSCLARSYLITTVTSNKFWLEIPAETSCITGTRPKNPIFKMTLALKSRKRHRSEHGFLAF